MAFFGVAKAFPVKGMNLGTGEGIAAYSKLALASGVTGGIMAEVQGGRFGNGFISAGASAFLSPIPEAAASNPAGQAVVAAVIGGTVSRISGGKFANGAVTASFQFAMGRAVASSANQKESPIEEEGSGFAGKPYYVRDYSAPIVNATFVGVRDSEFLSSMLFSASADYYASVGIRVQFNEVSPGTKNSLTIQLGNGTPMTETYALASFATISTGIFGAQRSDGVFLNQTSLNPGYTFSHEFAHTAGLNDRYTKAGPNFGYQYNLMGRSGATNLYQSQIATIRSNLANGWSQKIRYPE